MSNAERQVAKKGFGTVMVNRLREVDHASTEELAKLAGVTVEQAYSRLMFLQSQEKMVVSAGKGPAKVWSMAGKAPPPAPVVEASRPEGVTDAFNRSHGWKPSLKRYEALSEAAKVGDKLLVEYPDKWRHSAVVAVSRPPNAEGAALCWDIRNKMCTFVPVTPEAMAKHNVRVVRVTNEKDLIALENE
jgi:hypothetical protein